MISSTVSSTLQRDRATECRYHEQYADVVFTLLSTDCCGCVDDTYVICIPCYDNGARCKNPEEHTLKLRYLGQGLISVEEYSPWVKLCTLPKDLEK